MAAPAATFLLEYADATNANYQKQVGMAMIKVSQDVGSEATNTANHANRAALSRAIATDPVGWAQKFAFQVATQVAAAGAVDTDVYNAIAAVWNTVAGS